MKLNPPSFSFALLTLLGLSSSGCGLEYGKGGFIDRAVAKDAREEIRAQRCKEGEVYTEHDPKIKDCVDQDSRPGCHRGCYLPQE